MCYNRTDVQRLLFSGGEVARRTRVKWSLRFLEFLRSIEFSDRRRFNCVERQGSSISTRRVAKLPIPHGIIVADWYLCDILQQRHHPSDPWDGQKPTNSGIQRTRCRG